MKSWKTTFSGIIAIVVALADVATKISNDQPIDVMTTVAAIMAGIGLIFAKDGQVTGGRITQPTVSNPASLIEDK